MSVKIKGIISGVSFIVAGMLFLWGPGSASATVYVRACPNMACFPKCRPCHGLSGAHQAVSRRELANSGVETLETGSFWASGDIRIGSGGSPRSV